MKTQKLCRLQLFISSAKQVSFECLFECFCVSSWSWLAVACFERYAHAPPEHHIYVAMTEVMSSTTSSTEIVPNSSVVTVRKGRQQSAPERSSLCCPLQLIRTK